MESGLPKREVIFNHIDDGDNYSYSMGGNTVDIAFDFEHGEFILVDGKAVTLSNVDKVKQWIEKAIKTDAYSSKIYEYSHYGLYVGPIIGYGYDKKYIEVLLKNEIEYLMKMCSHIESISDLETYFKGSTLYTGFKVNLVNGENFNYEGEVMINV